MSAARTYTAPQAPAAAKTKPVTKSAGTAIQTKLDVGPAGDHYEREADAVAKTVMSGGEAPIAIPPTITPLTAQRKPMASPAKEEEKPAAKGTSMQRKPMSATADKEENKGKPVQRKAATAKKPAKEEEKPKTAQRKAGGTGREGGAASAGVEASVGRMQSGSASRMDSGTRGFMENRFGRDFSGVRVHNTSESAKAANAINARAFTVGRDVFFNRGEYKPHTRSGRELLAHELTHTVQQSGRNGVQAMRRIQRTVTTQEEDPPAPASGTTLSSTTNADRQLIYRPETGGKKGTIVIPELALPSVVGTLKGAVGSVSDGAPQAVSHVNNAPLPQDGQAYNLPSETSGRRSAIPTWKRLIKRGSFGSQSFSEGITGKLSQMENGTENLPGPEGGGERVLYLTHKDAAPTGSRILIGTKAELVRNDLIVRPDWSRTQAEQDFDVDHILELQIGGKDHGSNMWLLDSSYNRSSGATIASDLTASYTSFLGDGTIWSQLPRALKPTSIPDLKSKWEIRFAQVSAHSRLQGADKAGWTKQDMLTGAHLDQLKLLTNDDLLDAGLRFAEGQTPVLSIFPSRKGGVPVRIPLDQEGQNIDATAFNATPGQSDSGSIFEGLSIQTASAGEGGLSSTGQHMLTLSAQLFDGDGPIEGVTLPSIRVLRLPNLPYAGYVSSNTLRGIRTQLRGASPLGFPELELNPEGKLYGVGSVVASKPLFEGLPFELVLSGNDIMINAPIPAENLSLGPFAVTEASIGLGYGDLGIFLEGHAFFEIRNLGRGSITARAGEEGAYLEGAFNFITDFFDPANVAVRYDITNDILSASATLGVQSGKIPGVESGQIQVSVVDDTISVNGTINLGGPLAGSSVTVGYTQEEGLTIGGTFPLPVANLPAVQNATMTVRAARDPDSGEWSFGGTGTANLAVPGVTGQIGITYLDGVVTLTTAGTVEKGPASGTLNFTATNGAIDEEGNPIEGEIGNSITAWGRGTVSIQFGIIITGTAGIEYTQDNKIILSGSIALPPTYDLFERMEYNRNLLTIESPDFPIWGVSVAGIGVGIFAFFDARVAFEAYVGPGQIRNAHVDAVMDLDRPEEATIHGEGQFYVPAFAGLSLDVGGGLRARLAVAFAQGRLGLEGQLGIEADASADVEFDWDRTNGLAMQTTFSANARPKFRISANASVTVGVDLLLTEVSHTFGPWERTLGEFGPDMTLGVDFPVRWSEAEGLDLSLDNMTVREPQLDARSLVDSVFDRLAG